MPLSQGCPTLSIVVRSQDKLLGPCTGKSTIGLWAKRFSPRRRRRRGLCAGLSGGDFLNEKHGRAARLRAADEARRAAE